MMKYSRTLALSSILALSTATPSLALTPEEALADQVAQMELYGMAVTINGQSGSGDSISVESFSMTAPMPEGEFTLTMGGATYSDLGDGTVEIIYPAEIPLTISGISEVGEEFEMVMTLAQSGTRTVASGTPDKIRYDFVSDSFSLADITFNAPAEATELDMDVSFTMNGLEGMMELGGGTVREYTAAFVMQSIQGLVDVQPPGEDAVRVQFDVADVAVDYEGALAAQELMGSFADAIQKGNRTKGSASHGALSYVIGGSGPEGEFEGSMRGASGSFEFGMGLEGLSYGGTTKDLELTFGGSAIPFPPMTIKLAESGGRFVMPVVPSDEEQDVALRIAMIGLEVDPFLWGMIDPGEQLPRDPATLIIDMSGTGKLTEDIFDPEVADQLMGPPGEVNSMDVNEVKLTIAGAELTGDGAFTFNNAGGIPMPAGTLNMMLVGGNTLLDTLVGMGLIPEEQAMGARMMTGLFARPGDGPDTLISTIEFKEDGSILANGQRIQ